MAESDAFLKKVSDELRDMDRREKKLRKDAEGIREQLAKLRQRKAELDRSLAVYRDVMGVGQESAATEAAEGTIADVALRVLREAGEPRTVGYLVRELQTLGKLKGGGASGRADYATLYQAISRDGRFVKTGKGEFMAGSDLPNEPGQPA